MTRALLYRLALALALLLQACGPASLAPRQPVATPAAQASLAVPGTVQLTVLWPRRDLPGFRAQAIPLSANAIVVSFADEQGQAPAGTPLVIARSPGAGAVAGEASATVPRGVYTLEALAYRETAPGPGAAAIARATAAGVTVRSGMVSTVSLALTSLQAPFVTGLQPRSGPVGTTLRVRGERLGTTPRVYFNATVQQDNTVAGQEAQAQPVSDAELAVTVPPGARSGNVVVVADGEPSGSSAGFAVLAELQIRGADEVPMGGAAGFQAVGVDSDGRLVPDPEVAWTSSDPEIVTVDPATGVARAGARSGQAELRLSDRQGRLTAVRLIRVLLASTTFASLDYFRAASVLGLFAADVAGGRALFAVGSDGTAMRSLDRAASWSLHAAPPGRVSATDAAADPAPGNLYMGLQDGRVFLTPAVGGPWVQVGATTVGGRGLPVCSIASDGKHLYAGLLDGTVHVTPVPGAGPTSVWTQVGSGPVQPGRAVSRLRIAGGKLFAGLGGAYFSLGSNVWQTPLVGDNNSVWEAVGLPVQYFTQTIFSLAADGEHLYAGTPGHLYTTPLADTSPASAWTELGNGISTPALANISLVRGGELLAAVGGPAVFRTAAPGRSGSGTWTPLGANSGAIPGGGIPTALLADGGEVFAGASNGIVYRLPAGGAWEQPSGTVVSSTAERVDSLGTDGRSLVVAGESGLAVRPLDGSGSWQRNNPFNLPLRVVLGAGGDLYAGVKGFYVVRIISQTREVRAFVSEGPSIVALWSVGALAEASGRIYAAGAEGGVWQSPAGTPDWQQVAPATTPAGKVIALASDGRSLAAATTATVFRAPVSATNPGGPWEQLAGYPGGASAIRCLAVARDAVYVGAANGSVYRYGAGPWEVASGGPVAGDVAVTSLATDGSVLFAGTAGKGVYRLDLAGGGWTSFGGPTLANGDITALLVRGNHLYAAANGQGVYWSL